MKLSSKWSLTTLITVLALSNLNLLLLFRLSFTLSSFLHFTRKWCPFYHLPLILPSVLLVPSHPNSELLLLLHSTTSSSSPSPQNPFALHSDIIIKSNSIIFLLTHPSLLITHPASSLPFTSNLLKHVACPCCLEYLFFNSSFDPL